MNIFREMFILLLSLLPLAAGTFFPFTTFRPSFTPPPPPRFGFRPPTSRNNNLVPLHSPILGLRILVPRELLGLFGQRSPFGINNGNYPRRPNSYNPLQQTPFPHGNRPYPPNGPFPNPQYGPFPQNGPFQQNGPYPQNGQNPQNGPFPSGGQFPGQHNDYPQQHSHLPPFDAEGFIAVMRAFYPDMIYQPDSRYPNLFAIRFPREPTRLPHSPDRNPSDYFPEQNQYNTGEYQPNVGQYPNQQNDQQNYGFQYK